mgnify:CR=1 FL=1
MKGKFGQRDFGKNAEFQRRRYQILQKWNENFIIEMKYQLENADFLFVLETRHYFLSFPNN